MWKCTLHLPSVNQPPLFPPGGLVTPRQPAKHHSSLNIFTKGVSSCDQIFTSFLLQFLLKFIKEKRQTRSKSQMAYAENNVARWHAHINKHFRNIYTSEGFTSARSWCINSEGLGGRTPHSFLGEVFIRNVQKIVCGVAISRREGVWEKG